MRRRRAAALRSRSYPPGAPVDSPGPGSARALRSPLALVALEGSGLREKRDVEGATQPLEFASVTPRQPLQLSQAFGGEVYVHTPPVIGLNRTAHEPQADAAIHQLHGRVMTHLQRRRQIPDACPVTIGAASDRKQELMLLGCQPSFARSRFHEAKEPAQVCAKVGQGHVLPLRERAGA